MITDELILYRNFKTAKLLSDINLLLGGEGDMALAHDAAGRLVTLSMDMGFQGNLWHTYLTYLLANNANAYTKAIELKGSIQGTINEVALHDMNVFYELFFYDITDIDRRFDIYCFTPLAEFKMNDEGKTFNKRIRDRICNLASSLAQSASAEEMKSYVDNFYGEYGVGLFGLNKAFKIHENLSDNTFSIEAIKRVEHKNLEDLVGYELQKEKLIANTEAFIKGLPANNCLLYGDAGTGKSSSVKGIMNRYYEDGLRLVEIYKHQFRFLNDLMAGLKDRNYKFIIYMDDLSFEDHETEYKYLKAIIEGGLERKPDNVLIYATSNRRHLIHENFGDKLDIREHDDLHESDTVEEKLSLYHRFGMTIYFGKPTPIEFMNIVTTLAERSDIDMDTEELLRLANRWEIEHGGVSGRTARQFIDHLLST